MNKPTQAKPTEILRVFLVLGLQSFGGGSSTLILIRQACIQRGWMEEDEFVRTWALVQMAPGINLVKLTALIGYKLRGWAGLAFAMSGLLLPSALVTVLMTAGYSVVRDQPLVQSALKGLLPATIGLSLMMSFQMAHPLLKKAYSESPLRLTSNLLILGSAGLLFGLLNASPVAVLLGGAAAGVLLFALVPVRLRLEDKKDNP
ncbi:MAG TPA: chromate transporter [Anaerolineae bacterium]